jgi:hypothetical protein
MKSNAHPPCSGDAKGHTPLAMSSTPSDIHTRGGLSPILIVVFSLLGLPAFLGGLWLTHVYLGEEFIVVWLAFAVLVLGAGLVGSMLRRRARVTRLRRSGLRGQAEILRWGETGKYNDTHPEVSFRLRVQAPGRQPYCAVHREVISPLLAGRLAPGSSLAVLVDPADPRNMMIDWGHGT